MPEMKHSHWTYRTPTWVIFDLDGTLADIGHRLHFIEGERKDWNSFNSFCSNDIVKPHIAELLIMMRHFGKNIAIFSGRDGTYRKKTEDWLQQHAAEYDLLAMREPKDYRSDDVIKKEMFEKHFKKEDVWLVIDDRDKVVNMWRSIGLTCLQCQKGDY